MDPTALPPAPQHPASIRRLSVADADAYVALRREMLADSPAAFASSPADGGGLDPAALRVSLQGASFAIFGAFAPAADRAAPPLLAAAGLARESKQKRAHIATLWGVYVTPAARGLGLGRAVVAAAIAHARTWEGLATLQLSATDATPAPRRLYESLGFIAWGREPDAIRHDARGYDETHMNLRL